MSENSKGEKTVRWPLDIHTAATAGFFGLRFLLPHVESDNLGWQYVGSLAELSKLASIEFTASSGVKIVIARHDGGAWLISQ